MMSTLATWSQRASQWRDVALAVALCTLGQVELFGDELYNGQPVWPGPVWLNSILIVALTAPFVWRRSRPLTAMLATLTVMTVSTVILGGSEAATTFIVLIAATFSGAAYSRHLFIVISAGLVASAAHGVNDPSATGLADRTWTYGLVAISIIIGRAVWVRQHRIASLESHAASAEERHTRDVEAATAAERANITRELHDIVSHAVSVIIIQAQVGTRALPADLDVVGDSLAAIETSARSAMSELRQLLTLLSVQDEPAAVVPMASLRQLEDLINQFRAAGLSIQTDIDIDPTAEPLPPMADLATYRVIQEALTNTMRHAPGATAHLRVCRRADTLELLVHDNGDTTTGPVSGLGTGRGLIGMRERVTLAGGALLVAAPDGTGFRVHALIPTREPETTVVEEAS